MESPSLCILIPCLNEQESISAVVAEYRNVFGDARILVVDNGSVDQTAALAREAGATVLSEPRRGKARAILTAFQNIPDDLVLMVDGDGSYPADSARLIYEDYLRSPVDMLSGIRRSEANQDGVFRPMHQAGTAIFNGALRLAFGVRTQDVFSGLRLFSRRFYMNVPVLSSGFELELDLTVQAIDKGFSFRELAVPFRSRTEGTSSKLRTFHDGWRILRFLVVLFRDYRPLVFFSTLAALLFCLGLLAGSLPIYEYFTTGFVGRFPLAILASSIVILGVLMLQTGLILESSLRHHREGYQRSLRSSGREGLKPRE